MDFITETKKLVEKAAGFKQPVAWSYPPQESLGHLSLPCFTLGGNPAEQAQALADKLIGTKKIAQLFKDILAPGPYLNFTFQDSVLLSNPLYKIPKKSGKVIIEFSNANTHKEYHIGHLRNIAYGDSVTKILQATGQDAKAISYINDFGIHTAKTVWQMKQNKVQKPYGPWLGSMYTLADKALHDNPDQKQEISQIMTDIEKGQGKNFRLWQKSRQWSIDYFSAIYKELDIKFDHTFYEHEVIGPALKTIKSLEKNGVLKLSQGALIADLEKYNLGVLPFVRSDGTALYPVADLELARVKEKKYHPKTSLYVVDVRQSLYFKQLFKVLELSGAKEKLIHLGYEFVSLPDGAMSSRSGRIVSYLQARDQAIEKARLESQKRHPDWKQKKIDKVAKELAIAALKFEMLKVSGQEEIVFDPAQALKFDGYTAAYLEYTYVRIQSLKKKAGYKSQKIAWKNFNSQEELSLAWKINRYGNVITKAAQEFDPSEIAKYLFELAKATNDYYQKVNIIKSEESLKAGRLEILHKAGQTLQDGLKLLGIKTLKEM